MLARNGSSKVVTIAREKSTCTVVPRELETGIGDVIIFQNRTAESISILISEENRFKPYLFRVEAGQDESVTVVGFEPGQYPYAVFCREVDNFAHASSMPIIIIIHR